jgi:hypothetical protein
VELQGRPLWNWPVKFGFVGASYSAKSNVVADEECINLFPETIESSGAQTQRSYFGTPGLTIFASLPSGPIRGTCWTGTRLFAVADDTLYEVFANGTFNEIGFVYSDGNAVSMVASQIQLLIISAGYAFCYTLTSATWAANTLYQVGSLIIDGAGHVQGANAAAWAPNTAYAVGAQIVDDSGNVQQAAQAVWAANTLYPLGAEIVDPAGHVQKATARAWAASTTYALGAELVDSNGNIQKAFQALWAANTAYAIGVEIVDRNGNVQKVTSAGTTGSSTPTWNMSGATIDNTVTWTYQASAGGNAGTSGMSSPVWSTFSDTVDGTGTLVWIYQGSASGNAGTSAATIPAFNDSGGTVSDGTGTLVWADQGAATGAGTSGTVEPTFTTGTIADSGTLIWVYQAVSRGAGTSGATEPTFSDTGGTTPDANTLVWMDQGLQLLNVTAQLAGTPLSAQYSDGYFIVQFSGNNKFQMSAILDGTTWPGIQVNAVSVFPENIVGIIVLHRELWVFGSQHAQPYSDTGSLEIFDVIPGALVETGLAATFGLSVVDNTVFWIGEDIRGGRQAWRANGYTPQRISNHAVETALSSYTAAQIASLVSYSYQDGGHLFWVLYIPGTDCSWVFDVAENLWHKRAEWLPATGTYGPHRSWNHVWAFGKHLVGDWQTGTIWEMKLAYDSGGGAYAFVTDNGSTIRRLRRSPTIVEEMQWIPHAELTVDFAPGLGPQPPLLDGDGNPRPAQAMLRWSDDRGSTWSNVHTVSVGFAGQYMHRSIWRRLGRSRYRVYEMTLTDPIPWVVVDAYLRTA